MTPAPQPYLVRTMFTPRLPIGSALVEMTPPERQRMRARACQQLAARLREIDPQLHVETRTPQVALQLELRASGPLGAIQSGSERFRKALTAAGQNPNSEALVRARRKD